MSNFLNMKFIERDVRDNKGLHKLYTIYAQEELQIIEEFILRLNELSRINPSMLAGIVFEYKANLIKSDTAYQEAAWRWSANDLLIEEENIRVHEAEEK